MKKFSALVGRKDLDWNAARPMLRRVEIHMSSIHIVAQTDGLLEPYEDRNAAAERLSRYQDDGDRVIVEGDELRLICNQRAVFRGGAASGSSGKIESQTSHAETELAELLRASHRLLDERNASPLAPDRLSEAKAAEYQRERRIMAIGLLAPDIQQKILSGKTPVHISADALLDHDLPLSWASQRQLFA